MKYQLNTLHLLVVLVIVFVLLQSNIIPSHLGVWVGTILLLVSFLFVIKLALALVKDRISLAVTIFPIFLFKSRYSPDNTSAGTYFDKKTSPGRFWSAFRSGIYVAVLFSILGALLVLGLV